jgi:VWFA-related protein
MFFLLLFVGLGLAVNVYGQDKNSSKSSEEEVLRVDTQLVDVPVVVTDKTGKPLLNLKQSNFVIYEDGKRQEVADFAAASAPFEVALLLDTSGSARSDLPLIKRAAENFIVSLRPGDKVSIVAFRSIIKDNKSAAVSEVLTGLTDNRARLKEALDTVKTSNGTPYYDGLLTVAEKVFSQSPTDEFRGRRALVALTDGVDSTSLSDFEEARENISRQ